MKSAVEERKAETREMIMQAARKVFSERGYHNAQISDIVREAGISTGSIYAHFKDKRDLFAQVTRENLENLRRLLREIRQTDRQDDDIRDRIGRMKLAYEAFFDYVDANVPQLLMILRSGYGVDQQLDSGAWDYFNCFADDFGEEFRKWERLGYLKGVNATLMGHIIIGAGLQVVHSYLMDAKFTRSEAIRHLMALNQALLTIYLTDKGREALGSIDVEKIIKG
jgi:AcrR family transcriptional regulator